MMADVYSGGERQTFEELVSLQSCSSIGDALKLARDWHRKHWFVESTLGAKAAFFNHGFRLTADTPEDRAALKTWLDATPDKARVKNSVRVNKYVTDVWSQWLTLDNVVSFWREASGFAFTIGAERCKYSDALGLPKLKVCLGYKPQDLTGIGLDAEERKRYATAERTLNEGDGEFFHVTTRAELGAGFAWPRLHRIFAALAQSESMEASERTLAHAGRLVGRQHKIGYEVKAGQKAGLPVNHYKAARGTAIERAFQGKLGFFEFATNFDHNILWAGLVDPKQYDGRKWDTITRRLMHWAGPVGFMLLAQQVSPYLLPMLMTEAGWERGQIATHLESVLPEAFPGCPPGKVRWSNRCFTDLRTAAELLKFLQQAGGLSLRTATEDSGYDRDEEIEHKKVEAKLDPSLTSPPFDPAHGNRPGKAGKDTGGRPEGTPDPPK